MDGRLKHVSLLTLSTAVYCWVAFNGRTLLTVDITLMTSHTLLQKIQTIPLTGEKSSAAYIELICITFAAEKMCNHTLWFYTKRRQAIADLGESFVSWIKEHRCQFCEPVDIKENMLQQVRTEKWYSSCKICPRPVRPWCVEMHL